MRKIKDAKDLTTNELIFFKGHAKATYMSDGRNVEEAINQISTEGGGGTQVQANWQESDTSSPSFIKNKPNIWQEYEDGVPTGSIEFNSPISVNSFNFQTLLDAQAGTILFDESGIHYSVNVVVMGNLKKIDIIHTGDGTKFLSDDGTYKTVSGGSGGGKEYVKVTLSNSEALTFMDYAESNNFPLEPNKVYYVDSFVSEGVSIIDVVPPTGDVGEYTVHFVCSGSPVFIDTFECPANWQWANGQKPTLENGTAYELSVVATKVNGTYYYKAVLTPFNRV